MYCFLWVCLIHKYLYLNILIGILICLDNTICILILNYISIILKIYAILIYYLINTIYFIILQYFHCISDIPNISVKNLVRYILKHVLTILYGIS